MGLLHNIILAYNLIGASISRRSPHTDVETPVATTTLYYASTTFVMPGPKIISSVGSRFRNSNGTSVRSDAAQGHEMTVSLSRYRTLLLTATDVDSDVGRAQDRYTSHAFDQLMMPFAGPSGSAVRIPSDLSIWHPTVLFDAVYAGTVVRHFGVAVADILNKWGDVFYPGGPTKAAHADDKRRCDRADANKGKYHPAESRRRRQEMRDAAKTMLLTLDVAMMYRFQAMEPEKVRDYLKGCEEAAAAAREHKGLEEKVNPWRESLAPLTDIDTDCLDMHIQDLTFLR
jgi:hypothetical protein